MSFSRTRQVAALLLSISLLVSYFLCRYTDSRSALLRGDFLCQRTDNQFFLVLIVLVLAFFGACAFAMGEVVCYMNVVGYKGSTQKWQAPPVRTVLFALAIVFALALSIPVLVFRC